MARKNSTPPSRLSPGLAATPAAPLFGATTKVEASAVDVPDDKKKRVCTSLDPRIYVFDQSGALTCSLSQHTALPGTFAWCRDIEYTVREHLDGGWCFDPGSLIVPMFPSLGIFAEVRVDEQVLAGSRQLFMPTHTGGTFSEGLDFIGFISPGEGRVILRDMLWEWVQSKGSAECASKMHSPKAERAVQSYSSDRLKSAANKWQTVTEGLCMYCNEYITNTGESNDWGF